MLPIKIVVPYINDFTLKVSIFLYTNNLFSVGGFTGEASFISHTIELDISQTQMTENVEIGELVSFRLTTTTTNTAMILIGKGSGTYPDLKARLRVIPIPEPGLFWILDFGFLILSFAKRRGLNVKVE